MRPLPFAWIKAWHAFAISACLTFVVPLLSGELESIEALIPSIVIFLFLFPFLLLIGSSERRAQNLREQCHAKQQHRKAFLYKFGMGIGLFTALDDADFSIHSAMSREGAQDARIITNRGTHHAIACDRLASLNVLQQANLDSTLTDIMPDILSYAIADNYEALYRDMVRAAADIRDGSAEWLAV